MIAAHPSVRRADLGLYLTTFLAVLAALVMVRLRAANDLVATGLRIHELEARRQVALEARALWLARYAEASQPEALARRARALGFGPTSHVVYLPSEVLAPGRPSTAWARHSALALLTPTLRPAMAEQPVAVAAAYEHGATAVASAADRLWP